MRPFLVKQLCCPVDGGNLEMVVFDQQKRTLTKEQMDFIAKSGYTSADFETEIISGLLLNVRKKFFYPVFSGVPRILTFHHPLLDQFNRDFSAKTDAYTKDGYRYAESEPIPGEKNVLASFSNEWTEYGYNEEVYWGQSTTTYNESLFSTLNNEQQDLGNKLVLEVGIGSGGSANFMSKKFNCNLIGVDLGYSVDVASKNFGSNPFLHIVQASAFNLPFRESTFDFVYSHGVIPSYLQYPQSFRTTCQIA